LGGDFKGEDTIDNPYPLNARRISARLALWGV